MCDSAVHSTYQGERWRNLFLGLLSASRVLYIWGVCRTVLAIHNEDEIPIHPWRSQKHNHELLPYSSEYLCLRCLVQCKSPEISFSALLVAGNSCLVNVCLGTDLFNVLWRWMRSQSRSCLECARSSSLLRVSCKGGSWWLLTGQVCGGLYVHLASRYLFAFSMCFQLTISKFLMLFCAETNEWTQLNERNTEEDPLNIWAINYTHAHSGFSNGDR